MKKGFTLIELIAVIVILSAVALIVFPNINKVIISSRKRLHDEQIQDINKSAEKWATDNIELLDSYHLNTTYVPLSVIQSGGYLEKEKVLDPLTKKEMDGCIQIQYDLNNKKYNYDYEELTCEKYAESQESGYVIYNYDSKQKKVIESSNSKKSESTGVSIYNYYVKNSILYIDGETNNGLYETDDAYVFRGDNVNNYVEFAGKTWRILSIDKKDFSLNLIATSGILNSFDEGKKIEFKESSSKNTSTFSDIEKFDKVLEYSFKTNIVDGANYSRKAFASTLEKNQSSLKVGLPSVLDYVNASSNNDCMNNYMSDSCKNNNYLYTIFSNNSTWTINNNGSQVWYVDTDGVLKVENSVSIKALYPVIHVGSNTYITNPEVAVGSKDSPYKIK